MSKTITANSGGIKLTSTQASYNPLTVNAGVTVAGVTYGVYGDSSQAWSVFNRGVISGSTTNGIYLKHGGVVHNYAGARITGALRGVIIAGGTASVANYGTIAGATGVYLRAGGYIGNFAATISAGTYGVVATALAASVTNASGRLSGGKTGVYLHAGGTVTNLGTTALLSGGTNGVLIGGAGTLTNSGTISATNTASGVGVSLKSGGTIANDGNIFGAKAGIIIQGGGRISNSRFASITGGGGITGLGSAPLSIVNQGLISGTGSGDGVFIGSGSIANLGTGAVISGGQFGVGFNAGVGTVANDGTITGSILAGVYLGSGGVVANSNLGSRISGAAYGVLAAAGAATVTNHGTLAGVTAAVQFANANGNVLHEYPGAALNGPVKGGTGNDSLILDVGNPAAAVISGVGARITGFEQLYLKPGATWRMTGSNTVASTLTLALASYSTLVVTGTLTAPSVLTAKGTGTLAAASTGRIEVGGAKSARGGQIVVDGGSTLLTGGALSARVIRNNGSIAALYAYGDGVHLPGAGTVTNSNHISGGRAGVSIGSDAGIPAGGALNVTNTGTGIIAGGLYGIYGAGGPATVVNTGTIAGASAEGVHLAGGGTITNNAAAQISGGQNGVYAAAVAQVLNKGTIAGTDGYGVFLGIGGSITNTAPALISGGAAGAASQGPLTIVNQGTVRGQQYGLALLDGGTATNSGSSALISGASAGIVCDGGALTLLNEGTVTSAGYGVLAFTAAVITNSDAGSKILGSTGLSLSGPATISNGGTITGAAFSGIVLPNGGAVTNTGAAALISGSMFGINALGTAPVTVSNQGTIAGPVAVAFADTDGNLFRTFPGAVVQGAVEGGAGTDTIELASGAGIGTITGIGSLFTGFENLVVDTGAVWQLANAHTLAPSATIALNGNASLAVPGTLTAPGNLTITGTGTLSASGGRIEVGTAGTALANQVVVDTGKTLTAAGVLTASKLIVASAGVVMGTGTIAAPIANSGRVQAFNGTLAISGILTGGTIQATAGSSLVLQGASNTASTVVGAGNIEIGAADSLVITGSIQAGTTALFILNSASLLEINTDASSAGAISFLGSPGGRLVVDDVAHFGTGVGQGTYQGPLIKNFLSADTVDLKNLPIGGAVIDSYNTATGLLQLHGGATKATLLFQNASLGSGSFRLAPDSGAGTLLTHS